MMFDIGTSIEKFKNFYRRNEFELQEFVINDGKKHPVAIICPGGAYGVVCSFGEGKPYAQELNKRGISAFVVFYRVRKKAIYPNPQDDLAKAVRIVMDRAKALNLDMTNYSVWGSSAGGHLAASFGTTNMGYVKYGFPKPGAIVLTYPVISMGEMTHSDSRDNLLGKNPSQEMIDFTSVEKQVDENYPDTFLWCGDSDQLVRPINSHMMDEALAKNNIRHKFIVYPGIDHGVGLGKNMICEEWLDKAVEFWLGNK